MKKLMILSAVAVFAALFTSCGKDGLSLSPATLSFGATDNVGQTLSITATGAWTLSVETGVTWLHVTPSSGTGNATVTVTVGDNTSSSRTAYITLTSEGVSKMASVTQAAYEASVIEYSNIPEGSSPYYPTYAANDYVTGPNSYGDRGMFEKLSFPVSGKLNYVVFGGQKVAVTGSIDVKVYASNQTTVLASKTINMSDVANEAGYTTATFATPINVTAGTTYYIGVEWAADFPLSNGFAIAANDYAVVESTASAAWNLDDVLAWHDIKSFNSWAHNVNLYVWAGIESSTITRSVKKARPSLENAVSRTISTDRK